MQRCRRVKAEVPDAPALLPFNRVGEQLPLWVIGRHCGPFASCPLHPNSGHSSVEWHVRLVPLADIVPAKLRYSPGRFVGDSFSITLFRLKEAGF
jgi:hypothetical protein